MKTGVWCFLFFFTNAGSCPVYSIYSVTSGTIQVRYVFRILALTWNLVVLTFLTKGKEGWGVHPFCKKEMLTSLAWPEGEILHLLFDLCSMRMAKGFGIDTKGNTTGPCSITFLPPLHLDSWSPHREIMCQGAALRYNCRSFVLQ